EVSSCKHAIKLRIAVACHYCTNILRFLDNPVTDVMFEMKGPFSSSVVCGIASSNKQKTTVLLYGFPELKARLRTAGDGLCIRATNAPWCNVTGRPSLQGVPDHHRRFSSPVHATRSARIMHSCYERTMVQRNRATFPAGLNGPSGRKGAAESRKGLVAGVLSNWAPQTRLSNATYTRVHAGKPIVFLLYVNDLPDVLSSPCPLFVGDLKFWGSNASIHQMVVELRSSDRWMAPSSE
ncbi:hypothetical protein CSKR_101392, partial [Clonorchis sinensis]